jgi:ABC-type antimicrobial peptide transport system permease subunit
MGVDGDPARVANALALREGRWLRRANEVVVGWKLSREKNLRVGDTVRLSGRDFTVVGIGKLRGTGFGGESAAYMDYRAFQQRAGIGSVFSVIIVDTRQPELTRARLEEREALDIFDRAQLVQRAEEVNASAVGVYWVFNLLALSVGALFVSNMLGRSVAERRLDFATLRAIGVPTRTILLLVTSEAVLICGVAGVVGIVISLTMGVWLNTLFAESYGIEFVYSADALTFALVFLMGLALGVASGLLPARQATRVDPVEVLREA